MTNPMNNIIKELDLSNHQKMMLAAMRTGLKDARIGHECNSKAYGARSNSAWAKWYEYGFQGLGLPIELQGMGLEL
jgi:hypothetical protein